MMKWGSDSQPQRNGAIFMETGTHEVAVRQVAAAVRAFYHRQESFRIFHGSTFSTRPTQKDRVVDISGLRNVLKIDPASRVAIVEPNVSMDKLVKATLQHGLIPPVVMEFPGITVGGGYAGSAGESSSFKYGYFNETINSVEMVLANGDVVKASKDEHSDLFNGAAGAVGTLGVTTLIELQLLPAKKYVKLVYHRTNSVRETVQTIQTEMKNLSNDYVDGILFSNSHGVVMTGELTDNKPATTKAKTFSSPWDPWFYLHVKESTEHSSPCDEDYIPLADYLFRYDRGGFWVGNEAFRYFGIVPFTRATRWFLNDFMHTRMLYRALHGSKASFGYMVQDLSLPYPHAAEFIDYTAEELGIWPLWLCPLRETDPPTFHPYTRLPGPDDSLKPMLNIGLWGRASNDVKTFVQQNQRLERRLEELGGRKVLYSHAYYTEKEFWDIYDRGWYDELRERFSATSLPTVYEKVNVDLEKIDPKRMSWVQRLLWSWPLAGLLGIHHAIKSKDYLLHRQLAWMRWGISEKSSDTPGQSKDA